MKVQQELPDSVVLTVIIVLILGTISYFIYGQWQVIEEMQHSANEVSAKQVAEKMEKERAELRAVSDGKKTLEDLDKEHVASEEAGKKSGSVSLKSLWSKDAKAASK